MLYKRILNMNMIGIRTKSKYIEEDVKKTPTIFIIMVFLNQIH